MSGSTGAPRPPRGAAPVGHLCELGPVEAAAVRFLRLWCEGPEAQARVWGEFAGALGPGAGRSALGAFEAMCELCARHGRRPLMRHASGCACLGGDEACLANLVAAAAQGEREDALLLATLIVRPDMAPPLVALAQEAGLGLLRLLRSARRSPCPGTAACTGRTAEAEPARTGSDRAAAPMPRSGRLH